MKSVSFAILCGGRSSRMGRDKALLEYDGQTLLERCAAQAERLGCEDVLLSGGHKLDGCTTVPDIYPHRGPLGGIHACLRAAKYESCLILAVDMPCMTDKTLRRLIDAHLSGNYAATVPMCGGRPQPLAAVYRRAVVPHIESLIGQSGMPVRALLEKIDVQYIDLTEREAEFANINSPTEYEKLNRLS